MLSTSGWETLCGGQFTWSTWLIRSNYHVIIPFWSSWFKYLWFSFFFLIDCLTNNEWLHWSGNLCWGEHLAVAKVKLFTWDTLMSHYYGRLKTNLMKNVAIVFCTSVLSKGSEKYIWDVLLCTEGSPPSYCSSLLCWNQGGPYQQ